MFLLSLAVVLSKLCTRKRCDDCASPSSADLLPLGETLRPASNRAEVFLFYREWKSPRPSDDGGNQ